MEDYVQFGMIKTNDIVNIPVQVFYGQIFSFLSVKPNVEFLVCVIVVC